MSIVLYVVLQLPPVAIGQLQLQLSHSCSLTGFLLAEMWLLRGPRGGLENKFSRLAIARHIFRPPHKLCYNSTTALKSICFGVESIDRSWGKLWPQCQTRRDNSVVFMQCYFGQSFAAHTNRQSLYVIDAMSMQLIVILFIEFSRSSSCSRLCIAAAAADNPLRRLEQPDETGAGLQGVGRSRHGRVLQTGRPRAGTWLWRQSHVRPKHRQSRQRSGFTTHNQLF